MKRCEKDVEIELADGTTVEAKLVVTGVFDEMFNSEASKGEQGAWLVESWKAKKEEDLDEDQEDEFDEKIEEIVFTEKWDWESALDADEDDEDEEDEDDELEIF